MYLDKENLSFRLPDDVFERFTGTFNALFRFIESHTESFTQTAAVQVVNIIWMILFEFNYIFNKKFHLDRNLIRNFQNLRQRICCTNVTWAACKSRRVRQPWPNRFRKVANKRWQQTNRQRWRKSSSIESHVPHQRPKWCTEIWAQTTNQACPGIGSFQTIPMAGETERNWKKQLKIKHSGFSLYIFIWYNALAM